MQRRNFLRLAGGGVILAATGATAFLTTRTPTRALAPWGMAGSYDDPRLQALSYAILAPNPHNQQPWLVTLEGEDRLSLFYNDAQGLPHTDPQDRQLTIGLGCFLELMQMAAAAQGYAVKLDLFPDGFSADSLDARPVAQATFTKATPQIDPLWAQVLHRRSNKEPYDTERPVSETAIAQILSAARHTRVGGSTAPDDVAYWRDVTTKALQIELTTPHTFKESVDVFRIGKREINANPDGIDLGGPMFDTLHAVGLFNREAALDTESMAFRGGVAASEANAMSAMGHLWMVTEGNSRLDQIAVGADWLRLNLACTAAGIGFQPMSQALQEYPEMAPLYRETHARLAPDGGTVQMLSRIGYGPQVDASPRWPIESKLVPA